MVARLSVAADCAQSPPLHVAGVSSGSKRVREEDSLWACTRDSTLLADLEPLERRIQRRRLDRDRELSQQRSAAAALAPAAADVVIQPAPAALQCNPAPGGCGSRNSGSASATKHVNRQPVAPVAASMTWSSVQIDALRQELTAAERTVEELKAMLAEAQQAQARQ